ncbi:MAG: co-chaperone protein DjlA [marine bacterium B5-7]|nr:MAG: co-chaperone protein DjlA [marine bacterium B5-7]
MAWWGKLAGGAFGFMFGGPLGALLGAVFGHQFDKGVKMIGGREDMTERTQAAFFTATFAVMGHIAKADGRVSEAEISQARSIMGQMRLSEAQREIAIKLFNAGKADDFDLEATLDQFKAECHRRTNLIRFFLEIQIMTAMADGILHDEERNTLLNIATRLGIPRGYFEQLLHLAQGFDPSAGHAGAGARSPKALLNDAYELLDITPTANDAEIKRAYRRLMNQHHPDKLVSRGMPEEMIEIANRKSQEIRKAYDIIRDHRKSRSSATG